MDVFAELVVVKRSGQRVGFNGNKVALAIKKAFDSIYETYDEKEVNLIYENVLKYIEDNYKERKTINVEDIQDIIEDKLKEAKQVDVYESFNNYRIRRTASRKIFEEKQQHKFIKAMEKLVANFKGDSLDNPTDILLKFGKTISEEFAKSYLIDSKYVRNHEEGNIYIHNLDFYALGATKSSYIDLSKIKVTNCYIDHLIKLLLNIKKEQYGEHTITSVDYVLSPYLVSSFKDIFQNYLYKYLDIEGFLDYVDFGNIEEEIETFEKIDIDMTLFNKFIKSDKVLGIFKKAYNDALKELKIRLNKDIYVLLYKLNENDLSIGSNAFALSYGTNPSMEGKYISSSLIENVKNNDFNNITLIFKVKKGINTKDNTNYSILEETLNLVLLHKKVRFAFVNTSYNSLNLTDYKTEAEYLPNGERVLDNINPDKSVSTGRMVLATTSINLSRIALNNQEKSLFFKELENVLELAKNELIQSYEYLSNKPKETFKYLFKENIFMDAEKLETNQKVRKVLRNGTLNIGIVGLVEATTLLSNKEDVKLSLEILEFIKNKIETYSVNERVTFTVKESYTPRVGEYFLSIDKTIYGTIPNITDKSQYAKFINIIEKMDLDTRMKYIGIYQSLTNGGHVFQIETKNSIQELNNIIDSALQNNIGYLSMKVSD